MVAADDGGGLWRRKRNAHRGITVRYAASIRQMKSFQERGMLRTSAKCVPGYLLQISEAVAVNRLMELPFRHLSESDKNWLENRIHDKRPEVSDMAREVYRECFPHAERNAMKKQLVISMLDFEIHTEVYQEYGDWENVDQRFHIMRKERTITFLDAGSCRLEQKVKLDGGKIAKLLRWAVHSLEIFMWPQDYFLVSADGDPFMELMPEIQTGDIFDLDDVSGESGLEEWENFERMENAEPE